MTSSPAKAIAGAGSRPVAGSARDRHASAAEGLQRAPEDGEAMPRTTDPAESGPNAAGRQFGEIIAVGTRPAGGGRIELADPPTPGEPTMRWLSHAHSIDEIEIELNRIWAQPNLLVNLDGGEVGRHIAARTSVMNLVVVARQPEIGERSAETIQRLTGRHPSRTLVVLSADPDGPPWLDARIQAHCVLPREDAPETCTELIFLTAGGETGRHLTALVEPLLVHDLPVTVWWPGEPPLDREPARDLLEVTDRLVIDGSAWAGDGLRRLYQLAGLYDTYDRLSIRDFALVRQSRWREAIACVFDMPDFLPFLGSIRRIAVTYGTHDETGAPGSTNVVKPLYHVAWLASRLGLRVSAPLAPVELKGGTTRTRRGERAPLHRGLGARLRGGGGEIGVVMRPVASAMPAGTTLRVEILAERRGSELRTDVTAEAENVHVHTWLDGVQAIDRTFKAPRRGEVDLLGEALETGGRDPLAVETIRKAAELIGPSA
jgi:hypothetical protein